MKKILVALLLMCMLCQTAFAEFITILPVSNRQIENVASELVSMFDIYGKTTTIRYWVDKPKSQFVAALNNTNIVPNNCLMITEDLLVENKIDGIFIGAESQVETPVSKVSSQVASMSDAQQANLQNFSDVVGTLGFSDPTQSYLTKARSSIALATLIDDQTNAMLSVNGNASELVALNSEDTEFGIESGLMAGDKTTIMDMLLSGMTRSTDYELPMSTENIVISGIGGAILNGYSVLDGSGGGSGGGGYGGSHAGAGGSTPEPATWAMLLMGSLALMWFRKNHIKRCTK